MDKNSATWKNLQRFANEHKLILEDNGEVGFGRQCVGFLSKGGGYVDYNPTCYLNELDDEDVWPPDDRLEPPEQVRDAYHKHDCFAVLVHGDKDAALVQLNQWIEHLEAQGKVCVADYKTGAKGIQAIISGIVGYAIRLRDA